MANQERKKFKFRNRGRYNLLLGPMAKLVNLQRVKS